MGRKAHWQTREIMLAILDAVRDYQDAGIPMKKTDFIQGMFSTNYAYALGIVNAMFVFGLFTDREGFLYITDTGRDFLEGIPF